MEKETNEEACWRTSAIKQGYIIKFHRGLVKAPKMLYFVLTPNGLVSFNYKPDKDSVPLGFLTFDQLSSIKVDQLELNSCKLPCMFVTSKTTSNFLLAFSRKEERDDWMVAMMAAFSEALVATRPTTNKPTANNDNHGSASMANFGGQTQRTRRKRNRGHSLRRTKSCNAVGLNEVTVNTSTTTKEKTSDDINSRVSISSITYEPRTKRKSLSDINVITHEFPYAWVLEAGKHDQLQNTCFDPCAHETPSSTNACDTRDDTKTHAKRLGIMSRIRSRFEHSTKLVNSKS